MRILKLILLFIFLQHASGFGQLKKDSISKSGIDTIISLTNHTSLKSSPAIYQMLLDTLLSGNKSINLTKNSNFIINKKNQHSGKEYLFYLITIIILIFSLFKIFYNRYFNNIFRVFFNTSLRQNQLTDLLLQARLPSLIFNLFFSVTGGLYIWLLLTHYYLKSKSYNSNILLVCIFTLGVIYLTKFCVLKFIGWITGMSTALNTYVFVIFLINKIIGVTLIPFIIIFAFAPIVLYKAAVIISLLLLSVFFIARFLRSYSLLQHQLNITRFHFILYITSFEVLPLIIIYKLFIDFFVEIN